jgi:hypothetical protein
MGEAGDETRRHWIANIYEHDWNGAGLLPEDCGDSRSLAHDDIGRFGNEIGYFRPDAAVIAEIEATVDGYIATFDLPRLRQCRRKRRKSVGIKLVCIATALGVNEHPNPPHALRLLRARHHRPSRRTNPRDELPPSHHRSPLRLDR